MDNDLIGIAAKAIIVLAVLWTVAVMGFFLWVGVNITEAWPYVEEILRATEEGAGK